jgi:predicted alpha/beta-fold hydrolase
MHPALTLLVPDFVPRAPWWGAHLQTLKSSLLPTKIDLSAYPAQRLSIRPEDGSGDTLLAELHQAKGSAKPLIILVHGLGGSGESNYIRATALAFLEADFPVLRWHLRGAGPSAPLCRQHYFAGRSHDLRLLLAGLAPEVKANGVMPIGFSLGGNLVLKFMGEGAAAGVIGAASICAPIDLATCAHRIDAPANAFYRHYILAQMRREVRATPATLDWMMKEQSLGALSLWTFDDAYTAPRNGFKDALDLYAKSSANQFIAGIPLPTLLIHAADDPWIPRASYDEVPWHANANVRLVMTASGGHVGFHGKTGLWYPPVLTQFANRLA